MQLTGVAGWPISHSRSPRLHQAAFRDLGLDGWDSQHLPIPPDVFEETVRALPQNGFVGINVTIPHKEAGLALADVATDAALAVGAANTLTFSADGSIAAANTDSPAIQSIVEEHAARDGLPCSALVLGAGGSARAAIHALKAAGVPKVAVWNRNEERAQSLVNSFEGTDLADSPEGFELLLNATPVGLVEGTSPADIGLGVQLPKECKILIDLVYADGGTELERIASGSDVVFVNGLEILVRQGALSIEIWTGKRPSLEPLRLAVASA